MELIEMKNLEYKYALERLEPFPNNILRQVRNELRKNMTNLPERWKAIMFAKTAEELIRFVDTRHRVVDWNTLEIIYRST
ncbi:MAG: hypothetical protein IMZ53_05895 [Thermoplasmata archaeon]|nr:hypothetical protein [Thermoplasmata archaeon]